MLDGLLGRSFSSKCKSWIKMTKTRLEVITRRRNAMQKYLKKDIADLLANGLDTNAYSRAEGLLIELNLSSCYAFIAQICDSIPKRLSVMQKQRECPEDCREAISSLVFAAARFADLPELRYLRDTFTERYGKTLEAFANKEFVDNLSSKTPPSEKKLQLMREIAKEFSINWDSKAIEQNVAISCLHAQNAIHIEETKVYNFRDDTLGHKRENREISSTGRQGLSPDGYILHGSKEEITLDRDKLNVNGRQGYSDDKYRLHVEGQETISEKVSQDDRFKPQQAKAHTTWKKVNLDTLSQKEYTGDALKSHKGSNDTLLKRDILDNSRQERRKNVNEREGELLNQREDTAGQQDRQEVRSYKVQNHHTLKPKAKIDGKEEIPSAGANHKAPYSNSVVTEEAGRKAESTKPLPPPPYTKPNGGKYTASNATSDQANKAGMGVLVNDLSVKAQTGLDRVDNDESRRAVGSVSGNDDVKHRDDYAGERKPQSVRRRHLKPPAVEEHRDNNEGDEVAKRDPNRRGEVIRQGVQQSPDNDHGSIDEEKIMDKLLLHYSKKPSKFAPPMKINGSTNPSLGHHVGADDIPPQMHRRNGVAHLDPKPLPLPSKAVSRAVSLPPEPATPDTGRAPARATSFQPEMMNPGGHVHPRMPDYDDLAARIASLRCG